MRTTIGCDAIDIAPIHIVGMVLCVVLLVLLEFEPLFCLCVCVGGLVRDDDEKRLSCEGSNLGARTKRPHHHHLAQFRIFMDS